MPTKEIGTIKLKFTGFITSDTPFGRMNPGDVKEVPVSEETERALNGRLFEEVKDSAKPKAVKKAEKEKKGGK